MTQPNTPEIAATADASEPLASTILESQDEGTANTVTLNEGALNAVTDATSGGARLANANRLTHGLDSAPEIGRQRLALGKLPTSLARCERAANAFRRALEDAVELAHGRIEFAAALSINTAARWERHSLLAMRWLREHGERMDDAQRLAYSREIARASTERDKAVERLKLQPEAQLTIAATLYGRTA